jgi:hypothetical protein
MSLQGFHITGLQSRIIHHVDENAMLKKANIDMENRITELERQHDADDQYSKRNFFAHLWCFWKAT